MADLTELAKELWDKVQVDGPIRDGDCLVIRLSTKTMNPAQFAEVSDQFKSAFTSGGLDVHLVVLAGVEQILIYRPEASNG